MSKIEGKGPFSSSAPAHRKPGEMSDDSEIEEVGRKIVPTAAKHQRPENGDKARSGGGGGSEDHSRILSSSFNWGPTANFPSTLDIDAIKVK